MNANILKKYIYGCVSDGTSFVQTRQINILMNWAATRGFLVEFTFELLI